MRERIRTAPLGVLTLAAASLAGCANYPMHQPVSQYPSTTPQVATAPAQTLWGRVTNIEYVPAGQSTAQSPNVLGAVVGGVTGAVLGRQIGGGSGRDAATVLGGLGGAAVGSQVGRGQSAGAASGPSYRISVQTDQGEMRAYEVSAYGDLRVGDRVRIENGVIYRS